MRNIQYFRKGLINVVPMMDYEAEFRSIGVPLEFRCCFDDTTINEGDYC